MLARSEDLAKPGVYVAEADYEQLANLSRSSATLGATILAQELDRAVVVQADELPQRFVRLGSSVAYRDLLSGRSRTVQVVVPEAADIDENRLSVLSPVGAALIGLCEGASFSWTTDDGRPRVLVVERVAEAA